MSDNTCPPISPSSLPFGQNLTACIMNTENAITDLNTKPRTNHKKLTFLQISEIRTDGDTQNRCEFDRDLVNEYSRAMHEGTEFPPIHVFFDGTHYWLADGFHRHKACQEIGLEFVEVTVQQGSLRDAQLYSFSANANHGKRRTNADKRKAVMAMLADAEWSLFSDREIARVCSVDHKMVSRLRSESSLGLSASEKPTERTYTTKHGTQAKMKTAKIGKKEDPVKDALDAGEITPEQAAELAEKPKVVQKQLVEKAKKQKKQDDEYTPPPSDFDEEKVAADALVEHEIRMAQLALLVEEDDKLADAVKQYSDLSKQTEMKDRELAALRQQIGFLTNELNFYKQQIKRYKAVATKYNKQQAA